MTEDTQTYERTKEQVEAAGFSLRTDDAGVTHLVVPASAFTLSGISLRHPIQEIDVRPPRIIFGSCSIEHDGSVTIPDGVTIPEAARQFWSAVEGVAREAFGKPAPPEPANWQWFDEAGGQWVSSSEQSPPVGRQYRIRQVLAADQGQWTEWSDAPPPSCNPPAKA